MGRLSRCVAAAAMAAGLSLLVAGTAAAFDGFGTSSADSTYGRQITFTIGLDGDAPDRLELLVRLPEEDGAIVIPVEPSGGRATYVWDTSVSHITPNTLIGYQWRAIEGDDVTVSREATYRYTDDRPGLDWQTATLGEATVHWYGGAENQARRFGELTAVGVDRAEDILGTELAGPVDVFVYDSQEDFFGALGPGAREWTGAAAFSDIRTIFMWLGGGSSSYLEQAMVHEVTHIVFHDATHNPFHEPARWLNEGFATWSENQDAGADRGIVESEAADGQLLAFDAITEQFPIGDRAARLSYAEGTTMVDLIIDRYGTEAMRGIAAALRDGASDDEALEAGTGVPAAELYADFYAEFGVEAPTPVTPDPIAPSDVDRPEAGSLDPGGVDPDAEPPDEAAPGELATNDPGPAVVALLAVAAAIALGAAFVVARRSARGSADG